MKPLRVLMISEPGRYGVLIYVRDLINYLHRIHPEIIVDYIYSSVRGSSENQALVAAVEQRGGATFDMRTSNAPSPADWRASYGIRKLAKRWRPDVIHAHSSKAGALARGLFRLRSLPPVIYSPHGYYGMSMRGGMKERVFNKICSVLGQWAWTHNISIHERDFARRVLHLPPDRTLLIFSGVDLERFTPADAEKKAALREKLDLPPRARLLVTLGREAYEKNYGDLYRALGRILPSLPEVHFAHAGSGSAGLRERLPASVRPQVTAFSFLDQPEQLLQAADGFVLPSRTEAFGLAAYEAMGCGLPVILSSTMGLLTLKELGFSGIRWVPNPVRHGDISEEIGAAIRDWAAAGTENPPDRAQMFRWFNSSDQFEKLVGTYRLLATQGTLNVEELEDFH